MAYETKAHEEHVTSLKTYLLTAGGLFVLTVVTVAVSYLHFGAFNLLVAMGIATLKASLVAFIFMHLYYDDKLYLTIFVTALLMLSLFIVLTLFDTLRRDDIYQQTGDPINRSAEIYQQQSTAAGDTTASDSAAAESAEGSGH